MLEPREADIPALFLVFVVFPLVTYILLGKWNEAAKKKERIDLLAQLAAEEALRAAEAMATATVIYPVDISPKPNFHPCARCFGPATTSCSKCKSVRYCSGKCQIVHWRHGHKQECQMLEMASSNLSSKPTPYEGSFDENVSPNENLNSRAYASDDKHAMHNNAPFYRSHLPAAAPLTTASMSRSNQDLPNAEETLFGFVAESLKDRATNSSLPFPNPAKSATSRHEIVNDDSGASAEEIPRRHSTNSRPASGRERTGPRSGAMRESHKISGQTRNVLEPSTDGSIPSAVYLDPNGRNASNIKLDPSRCSFPEEGPSFNNERVESSTKKISSKGNKSKSKSHFIELQTSSSPKPVPEGPREGQNPRTDRRGCLTNELKISQVSVSTALPAQGSNSIWEMGGMKIPGLRKLSKVHRQEPAGITMDSHKKIKVLFPYEEFIKCFCCEVMDLSPRGLLNCGNSCYANTVLQCLTCTKPLTIYLLRRLHSRHCRKKNWCLMCELEQHVMMLREGGGPLSPNRILSHMQSIGCQMGSGSQEDAHEFLRLLVTSMQSICLEGLGVEKEVDPRLQETTFIQHIFGGRLRSKVKCLRCQHESERYENIMDLTLEILGWVESLQDALTQFTACEDLDGENMYRCGRCAMYVRARKQLSIHEAPNILTIVLKRFQEGKYGKINKCITFPDLLDMIPFMTGTGDSPPLYMLYAVIVHLDTFNASFSGHYVSYVKDLQGTWFRINDTEVQPVSISQVMSEGAYMLFYTRSYPRPPRGSTEKPATLPRIPASVRQGVSKTHKFSSIGQTRPGVYMGHVSPTSTRQVPPMREKFSDSRSFDFSDATSTDWSLFTSSDDSSFTTESTRDSFSTADYSDSVNADPFSSIFNTHPPEYYSQSNISYRRFSHKQQQSRFLSEGKGFVLDSYLTTQPLVSLQSVEIPKQISASSNTELPSF
ncbi:ubiquitin carboxyl-terminal hydrolase 15-like isoform X2 [Papaver somniferum]|uniref:ubiquitin carboxyl-terminal hydrolase 15-like isoform X2 n=1 Tax=Papaver somniferum TaxID=3469 RepID=UPI000E7045ED|nr:ubiquitin carboxyl-terminal hydrolase 15-like isoform X2 [Papaver somniferum]